MPVTIGSNIASLMTQRQLSKVSDSLAKTSERLASGLRINSAADDAAGLSISTSLLLKDRTLGRAILNANDGISMLSIADGALRELSTITTRLQELAQSAANGAYTNTQRAALNKEAGQLTAEFNRIVDTTTFNGTQILHGENTTTLMIGDTKESMLTIDFAKKLMGPVGTGVWEMSSQVMEAYFSDTRTGDFNNDGIADLIVGPGWIYLGNGDGTFKTPVVLNLPARGVTTGDFNGDGYDDIAEYGDVDDLIKVYISNGNGTMKAPITYVYNNDTQAPMTTADLNGDGKLDLILVNANSPMSYVTTLLGNGDGTFQALTSFATGSSSTTVNELTVFDANNDGILDILHTTAGFQGFLALGNGNGTFKAPYSFSASPWVSYGDINNDGNIDLVNNYGQIYFGNGNGTFSAASTTALFTPVGFEWIAERGDMLKDLNGDGNLDILLGPDATHTGDMVLFLGNGDGTFAPQATQSGFTAVVDIADLNGDGALDLVMSSPYGPGTRVALQITGSGNGISPVNLATAASARDSMSAIDNAANRVSAARAALGATESRLRTAISNLQSTRLAYQEANSRIMDADIATEVADYQRLQIQQQASTAILAHANLSPQIALRLIEGSKGQGGGAYSVSQKS